MIVLYKKWFEYGFATTSVEKLRQKNINQSDILAYLENGIERTSVPRHHTYALFINISTIFHNDK